MLFGFWLASGCFSIWFFRGSWDCAPGFSEFRRFISSFVLHFVFLEVLDFYFYFLKILNGWFAYKDFFFLISIIILLLLVFRLFRLTFGCIKRVSLFLTKGISTRKVVHSSSYACSFICLQWNFAICPCIGLCNSSLVLGFRVFESWMYSLGSIFSGLGLTVRFNVG